MKIAIVMGTRPEIIKLSSIINHFNQNNSSIILTGQHYDYNLSLKFINELEIRRPDFTMNLENSKPVLQIAEMISKLARLLSKINPDAVVVQGDTNTVLAAGLTSLKMQIPICHVEAGLRSFDWRMPEEHNRIEIDHISDLLFASTNYSKKNLQLEGVHGKIFVTGNTVIDAINKYADISSKKSQISINNNFILMTLHRSENVDHKKTLLGIIRAVIESNQKVIFPVHPRTAKKLHEFGLHKKLTASRNITLMESIGYFDMLELMKRCSFIITDSGGIQEEATSPKILKKVLVIRKTTDRPESVQAGMSELVGTEYKKILAAIKRTNSNPKLSKKSTPYGKGGSSEQIVKIIKRYF